MPHRYLVAEARKKAEMHKPLRLSQGMKVQVTNKESPYFGKTGVLIEPRQVPVAMKLEYYWLVKLDRMDKTELFAPEHLHKLD